MANVGRPRMPDKVSSQMRLEPVTFAKVKAIAARESRSMNAQIEYWLNQCVAQYEAKHGAIEVNTQEETE